MLGFLRGPEGVPARVPDALAELAAHSEATVTWIGHATVLVRHDGVRYLTDPVWSERAGPGGPFGARRLRGAGLRAGRSSRPSTSSSSPTTTTTTSTSRPSSSSTGSSPRVRFFVPLGNGALLRDAGIEQRHRARLGRERAGGRRRASAACPRSTGAPAASSTRTAALWSSWAVLGAARRVYFSGDTGTFPGFAAIGRQLGPFDLAALPIGAYEPVEMMRPVHLNPEESVVAAAVALRAARTLGIHWGTYDLTDEPVGEPPCASATPLAAAGLEDERGWVFRIGETREF